VTFTEDLMILATDLKGVLELYEDNTPSELSEEIYSALAAALDQERKKCKSQPITRTGEPHIRDNVTHMTTSMLKLSRLVKDLAKLRGRTSTPKGEGA
jgi:hypothetical protein